MGKITWISFRELDLRDDRRPDLPSLRNSIFHEPCEHEQEIVHYLESAPEYSAMGCVVGDVIEPETKVLLFPALKTDGAYVWDGILGYYVRRYHVRLPAEFIERMAASDWRPPDQKALDWDTFKADLLDTFGPNRRP